MSAAPACPQCTLENTYPDGALWMCPDCGHEWTAAEAGGSDLVVRDKATKRAVVIRTLGQHGFDSGSTAAEKLGGLEDVTAAGDLDGDGWGAPPREAAPAHPSARGTMPSARTPSAPSGGGGTTGGGAITNAEVAEVAAL